MKYTSAQLISLVTLRIAIGWHFLYEGAVKLVSPSWSSRAFLLDSKGFLSGFFSWMANNSTLLQIIDVINEWGLTLIGAALILGLFNRIAIICGVTLLGLYYLSHPAWIGFEYLFPSEGNYFLVNKNILELVALLVLYHFPSSHVIGLERILRIKL